MDQVRSRAGALSSGVVRDDRIFPEVRAIGALIVAVLIVAFIILYFMPEEVGKGGLFSWKITPTMTPLLMGAGYISGGWFFFRLVFDKKWHHVGWGFLAITAFVWFMGLATLLHLDKFVPRDTASFWAWMILYIITPFLIPFLWWRNRQTDPGTPDPDDVVVPTWVRQFATVAGAILLLVAVAVFLGADWVAANNPKVPALAPNGQDLWPWTTTPLTARVLAGWFALPGIVGLALARDSRWSAWRIMIEAQMVALVLILVGAARAWGEFHVASNPLAVIGFIAGLAALLGGAVTLYGVMEMQRRRQAARTT